jgi:hypothetical protein
MAVGRQASFLETRTSSDHMSSLCPQRTKYHPALIKTSNQPSFISANFSLFTSAEALRSSDVNPVPSLNLKPNPHGGTAKKITSTKNLLRQLKKRK